MTLPLSSRPTAKNSSLTLHAGIFSPGQNRKSRTWPWEASSSRPSRKKKRTVKIPTTFSSTAPFLSLSTNAAQCAAATKALSLASRKKFEPTSKASSARDNEHLFDVFHLLRREECPRPNDQCPTNASNRNSQ